MLVGLFLGYVSLTASRNVGLFCPVVAWCVGDGEVRFLKALAALGAVAVAIILTVYFPFEHGIGEASYFPDGIVRFVKQRDLRGHMMYSYSFGVCLMWNLFPERRVFIDGRTEVCLDLLDRRKETTSYSRSWDGLLRDDHI